MRTVIVAVLAACLLSGPVALAQDEGIPVQVRVVDESGNPIPTAVVRHPEEAERHRVNTNTGIWEESVLYLADGSELIFLKAWSCSSRFPAPGYANEKVRYIIRKRKNLIEVPLEAMDLNLDDPTRATTSSSASGRDVPLDGIPIEDEEEEATSE